MKKSTAKLSRPERDYAYLDYNASAPLLDAARQAMTAASQLVGNPSSAHAAGRATRDELTRARRHIATLLQVERDAVVFTGNGCEANLLAIEGCVRSLPQGRRRVLTSAVEHPAVLEPLRRLALSGTIELVELEVDGEGRVRADDLARSLTPATGLVSIMLANNEIGTIQPIADLARLAQRAGAVVHTDATQAIGKLPVAVSDLGVDLLSFSPHKFGGPRGIGVLVRMTHQPLHSPLSPGRQETGLRGGTEDVVAAAGTAAALGYALDGLEDEVTRQRLLREEFVAHLRRSFAEVVLHSPATEVLAGTVNFSLPGIPGAWLVAALDRYGFGVSHGSACSTLAPLPSHVLEAIGAADLAPCAVRVSFGRGSRRDELRALAGALQTVAKEMRESQSFSPSQDLG